MPRKPPSWLWSVLAFVGGLCAAIVGVMTLQRRKPPTPAPTPTHGATETAAVERAHERVDEVHEGVEAAAERRDLGSVVDGRYR